MDMAVHVKFKNLIAAAAAHDQEVDTMQITADGVLPAFIQ